MGERNRSADEREAGSRADRAKLRKRCPRCKARRTAGYGDYAQSTNGITVHDNYFRQPRLQERNGLFFLFIPGQRTNMLQSSKSFPAPHIINCNPLLVKNIPYYRMRVISKSVYFSAWATAASWLASPRERTSPCLPFYIGEKDIVSPSS